MSFAPGGGSAVLGVTGSDADAVAAVVRDAGAEAAVDAPPADCDALVTLGEAALVDAAATAPDAPVLPVDVPDCPLSVPRAAVADAVADLLGGPVRTRDRPLVGVSGPGGRHRALFEAMLVTAEPAHISGFRVVVPDAEGDPTPIDDVRADGVVVATPAGSRGYAGDAGGPTVVPDAETLVVVPVAPFTVAPSTWVVEPPVAVTVTRDEGTVALRVDGRERGTVAPGETVRVERDGHLSMVVAPERVGLGAMEKT